MHIDHLSIPILSVVSERHSWIAGASAFAPSAPRSLPPMHSNHLMIPILSVVSERHSWIAGVSAFTPSAPIPLLSTFTVGVDYTDNECSK